MATSTGEVTPGDENDGVVVMELVGYQYIPRLLYKLEGFEEDGLGPGVTDLSQSSSELVQHSTEQ